MRVLCWFMLVVVATLTQGVWAEKLLLKPSNTQRALKVKKYKPNTNIQKTETATVSATHNSEPPLLTFPFEYVGKFAAGNKETILLSKGERIFSIAEGDTLDSLYRLERLSKDAIELSYLTDARSLTIVLENITHKATTGTETKQIDGVTDSVGSSLSSFIEDTVTQPNNEPPTPAEEAALKSMEVSPPLSGGEVMEQIFAPAPKP